MSQKLPDNLERFLIKKGIRNPRLHNYRENRDHLIESFREYDRVSLCEFGIEPIKMITLGKRIFKDAKDYKRKTKEFSLILKNSSALREKVISDYDSWRRALDTHTIYLRDLTQNLPVDIKEAANAISQYIYIRKKRRIYGFRLSILKELVDEELNEILVKLLKNIPDTNKTELIRSFSQATKPEEPLLEEERFKALQKLSSSLSSGENITGMIETFYSEFYNLDYSSIASRPKTRRELIKEAKKPISQQELKIERGNPRQFLSKIIYNLPEKIRAEQFAKTEKYLKLARKIGTLESWNRKTWTRLQVALHPIINLVEKHAKEKEYLPTSLSIPALSYKELSQILDRFHSDDKQRISIELLAIA